MTIFVNKFWWQILTTNFDVEFRRQILTTNFGNKFWQQILATNCGDFCFTLTFLNFFRGAQTYLLTYWLTNPVGIQWNKRFTIIRWEWHWLMIWDNIARRCRQMCGHIGILESVPDRQHSNPGISHLETTSITTTRSNSLFPKYIDRMQDNRILHLGYYMDIT
jgi:hypothetical protein